MDLVEIWDQKRKRNFATFERFESCLTWSILFFLDYKKIDKAQNLEKRLIFEMSEILNNTNSTELFF